jgi:Uma2 family endonuclease
MAESNSTDLMMFHAALSAAGSPRQHLKQADELSGHCLGVARIAPRAIRAKGRKPRFFHSVRIAITSGSEAPMNVQLPVRMDKAAFLDWVQGREERYELDRGRVIMMTGGSRAHGQITFNLAKALDARLDPNKWAVLPEFGVNLGPESVRFPDVIVDVAGATGKDLTATAPVLIAEVLSPSSERIDLGDKSSEYLCLPSLAAYCVFAQEVIKAWVWIRGPGGFPPGPEVFEGEGAVIRIEALALDLPLKDIYTRVRMD